MLQSIRALVVPAVLERLALLVSIDRRLEKPAEIDALISELSERFPSSAHRGEAMASAGDIPVLIASQGTPIA